MVCAYGKPWPLVYDSVLQTVGESSVIGGSKRPVRRRRAVGAWVGYAFRTKSVSRTLSAGKGGTTGFPAPQTAGVAIDLLYRPRRSSWDGYVQCYPKRERSPLMTVGTQEVQVDSCETRSPGGFAPNSVVKTGGVYLCTHLMYPMYAIQFSITELT